MNAFVARQPIFDGRGDVYAYELLFRPGPENLFSEGDRDHASASVIEDSMSVFGFEALTGGRRAFVNVTRRVLVDGLFRVLPTDRTVIELLETVESDPEVLAACRSLKAAGYLLALDDFTLRPELVPLLAFADFLKIDFLETTTEQRREWLALIDTSSIRLLAEKVETREQFEEALAMGFTYFQGYFFQRPEMLASRVIPPMKRQALRLIGELNGEAFAFERFAALLRQLPALGERLLADLATAPSVRNLVRSMEQAFALLGETPFRRWATLVLVATLGEDRPPELVSTCLVRARFGELLAGHTLNLDPRALFLAGLLSSLDALVGRPRNELLAILPLEPKVSGALENGDSPEALALELATSYERGDWPRITARCLVLGIPEATVPRDFRQAVVWANRVFDTQRA